MFYKPEEAEEARRAKEDPTYTAFFEKKLKRVFGISAPKIKKIEWTSTFAIRYRIAEKFHKVFPNGGAVLLAGDAAHIHSPDGAQGMNLGISDGISAGAAIAGYINTGSGDASFFEEHTKRRREMAVEAIRLSKFLGWMATIGTPGLIQIRNLALWAVGRFGSVRTRFAMRISGLLHR